MKQTIFLVFSLICFVFNCNAQIKEIQDSPFLNVQISGILRPVFPVSKEDLKIEKANLEKKRKELGYTKKEWNRSGPTGFDWLIINFNLEAQYFRLPDGRIAAFLTAQVKNKELVFERSNNIPIAKVQIVGQITSIDRKMQGRFEEQIDFSNNEAGASTAGLKDNQSYTKGLLLPPGLYKIVFMIKDLSTKKGGIRTLPLRIPNS